MAKVYYDLIKLNLKTIDDVPLRWKDAVRSLLAADGEATE